MVLDINETMVLFAKAMENERLANLHQHFKVVNLEVGLIMRNMALRFHLSTVKINIKWKSNPRYTFQEALF